MFINNNFSIRCYSYSAENPKVQGLAIPEGEVILCLFNIFYLFLISAMFFVIWLLFLILIFIFYLQHMNSDEWLSAVFDLIRNYLVVYYLLKTYVIMIFLYNFYVRYFSHTPWGIYFFI